MSLDGFIADGEGGYAWIIDEPAIDFEAYLSKIDTLIMGRGTYETAMGNPGGLSMFEAMEVYVVSTTLKAEGVSDGTLISSDVEKAVGELKKAPGKDIWLFGGGVLFRSLLEAGLVDRVEVAVVPVLLGDGVRVLPGLAPSRDESATAPLELHSVESFPSGMLLLKYDVARP